MTPVALHHVLDGPEDAPVVVLAGSLGATTDMWAPQAEALAREFRVLRYDHRGHGASPVPEGPYELPDLGADVLALLDAQGLERVHFGGLSLGGMVGMWLAEHAPERIDRLALCCTSARMMTEAEWAKRADAVRRGGMEAVADAVIERWLTPAFAARSPEVRAGLRDMLVSTPPAGYAACCGVIGRMEIEAELGAIRAPTLVIAGAEDPATPPDHAERIAAAVPGSRLAVVPDAAHLANVQQPAEVSRLLLEHLRG